MEVVHRSRACLPPIVAIRWRQARNLARNAPRKWLHDPRTDPFPFVTCWRPIKTSERPLVRPESSAHGAFPIGDVDAKDDAAGPAENTNWLFPFASVHEDVRVNEDRPGHGGHPAWDTPMQHPDGSWGAERRNLPDPDDSAIRAPCVPPKSDPKTVRRWYLPPPPRSGLGEPLLRVV